MLMVVAVIGTLAAMAVPVMKDMTAAMKLNEATRLVERELQSARLKAVASNRTIRVRLNCPTAGSIRSVEVLGTAEDNSAGRCRYNGMPRYPFPAADDDIMTRPNFDGPVRLLPLGATVPSVVLQFAPDGTASNVVSGVATTIVTPIPVMVTREYKSKTVTVNNAGKIRIE
jgi:Tfp pilus assembly protein FimT